MKAILGLFGFTAAYGIVSAANCTTKSTTTVTVTRDGTQTASSDTATGMTSVFNGTSSMISLPGNLTNPSTTTTTIIDETIYSYVTVVGSTCTIGSPCPMLASTSDPSITTSTDINTIHPPTDVTGSNTVSLIDETQTATYMLPDSSTLLSEPITSHKTASFPETSVFSSYTITSFVTSFTTLVITAPAQETIETIVLPETDAATTTAASTATTLTTFDDSTSVASIPTIITVTVSPLPSTSIFDAQTGKNVSITKSSSLSAPPFPMLNSTCHTTNTTISRLSMMSTQPSTITILPFLTAVSPARRLRVPAPFLWLSALSSMITKTKSYDLTTTLNHDVTGQHNTTGQAIAANNNSMAVNLPHITETETVTETFSTAVLTKTTQWRSTVTQYNATATSTSSYYVYSTVTFVNHTTLSSGSSSLKGSSNNSIYQWCRAKITFIFGRLVSRKGGKQVQGH